MDAREGGGSMSNNVLPNLSEWFEVPAGTTIPAYTIYTVLWGDSSHSTVKGESEPFMVESGDILYFTEHKIEAPKKTLEDVIRKGVGGAHTPAEIAKAVEALYAEQKSKQPSVIIDGTGWDEWRLNAEGTYDLWYGDTDPSGTFVGRTRERIEFLYGIKEERN